MVSSSTSNFRLILRIVLAMLFVAVTALNVKYSLVQPIWAPRNEMAHFDYIDKVSSLKLPAPGDYISDHTFQMTLGGLQWKTPPGFDDTRESMNREGFSYEVHQPPVYYVVMGVANLIPRWSNMSPPGQVKFLRTVQVLFLHLGFLLCIPIFFELKNAFGIDDLWGWFLAVFLGLVNIITHSSLGNDSFSCLAGNLTIFLLLYAWNREKKWMFILAALSIPTAFLVKYTNGLLYVPFGFFLVLALRCKKQNIRQIGGLLALSIAPVFLYLIFNQLAYGDLLKTGETQEMFAAYAGKHRGGWSFVQALIRDSFGMRPLRIIPFHTLPRYIVALLTMNILLAGWQMLQKSRGRYPMLLVISCAMTILTILSALTLNHLRPGVWWGGFRHFEAITFFWYLSLFGVPLSLSEKNRHVIQLLLAIALIGLVIRYTLFSFT